MKLLYPGTRRKLEYLETTKRSVTNTIFAGQPGENSAQIVEKFSKQFFVIYTTITIGDMKQSLSLILLGNISAKIL